MMHHPVLQISSCLRVCFQRVVFQLIARSPQPDVLPVPVCKSEQLHAAD